MSLTMAPKKISRRASLPIQSKIPATGKVIYRLLEKLFPICRSITGDGVRQTLRIIDEVAPLNIYEVPSGTKVFDWEIPEEWNIRDAYILDPVGKKIVDFKKNNLHVLGYSKSVDQVMALEDLQPHLYSLPDQPKAIPYVTSYYSRHWGFCITHQQRVSLKKGKYKVVIDSDFKRGSLTYGECVIPGKSQKEILISTYICHPSMANDNLSGTVIAAFLAQWIRSAQRRFTYRIVFVPETVGSLAYLSKNFEIMKKNVAAGFVVCCIGDNKVYSYMPSRAGNTLADKVALNVLQLKHPDFRKWPYLERGSDERQYCSPGIDLPVVSLMRSRYGTYSEYHTSMDNLNLVSPEGLEGSYELLKDCIEALENNYKYRLTCLGEPCLGKRGLYPLVSTSETFYQVMDMMNLIGYADGNNDLIDISNLIRVPVKELLPLVQQLLSKGLLVKIE